MATTASKSTSKPAGSAEQPLVLRDPALAAFLAWLVPGLGHIYQRRTTKGVLFMVCILGTFVYGLFLGGGRVVYAQWKPEKRLPYLCQIGVGLPALPALVQASRARSARTPLFGSNLMAPPGMAEIAKRRSQGETIDERNRYAAYHTELPALHLKYHRFWELGTVYTMIAGLLNMLVIYDAWAGPAYYGREEEETDDTGPPENPPDGS